MTTTTNDRINANNNTTKRRREMIKPNKASRKQKSNDIHLYLSQDSNHSTENRTIQVATTANDKINANNNTTKRGGEMMIPNKASKRMFSRLTVLNRKNTTI